MCLICVDLAREALTPMEALRNLGEITLPNQTEEEIEHNEMLLEKIVSLVEQGE